MMTTGCKRSIAAQADDSSQSRKRSAGTAPSDCLEALEVVAALGVRFEVTISRDGEFVEICKQTGGCATCKHSPQA